ncbi:MAG TPA: CcoQ/FixQ family Cbb3-type cytochrome c oxidase assembly chaperone [Rhizobiales bacterium]|nr:Cbb3-type cytochrome oxidase component FixQ [bacterium BMS3Bbin10]HDO53034.1 CcoQ/FixQ family Cbb3-type cytochrome c oxidase assembly chaperone [Hyphomicrobiales bacterium]
MKYLTVVAITQSLALLFFIFLFAVVLTYVFWPGNKSKFDRAARIPLDTDEAAARNRKS